MKRYLVFAFNQHDEGGGWGDFQFSADNEVEARERINKSETRFDTWQIVDLQTETVTHEVSDQARRWRRVSELAQAGGAPEDRADAFADAMRLIAEVQSGKRAPPGGAGCTFPHCQCHSPWERCEKAAEVAE